MGYPAQIISRCLRTVEHSTSTVVSGTMTETEPPKILYLPCVRGLSERIQRVCRRVRVKAVFQSGGTLRQILMKVKSCGKSEEKGSCLSNSMLRL